MVAIRWNVFVLTVLALILVTAMSSARAASETWAASPSDANWGTAGNWVATAVPGQAGGGTTNTDVATFLTSSGLSPTITIAGTGTIYNIGGINFGVSGSQPAAFVIGGASGNSGSALQLTSGGTIQYVSGATGSVNQTISAPLQIVGGSSYTFANNATVATSILTFSGKISGTTGATTLTLAGTNATGSNNNAISGAITNGTASSMAVTLNGSGNWSFTGANTYSGVTTVAFGNLTIGTNANMTGADGGWFIGDPAGGNTGARTVTFNGGSNIAVASGKTFQVGFTGASGTTATLNVLSGANVSNQGALNVQRAAAVTISGGSNWTQAGPMLVAAPVGSGPSTTMNVTASTFTYNNASSLIQISPASIAAGSATLTVTGNFITSQGFTDTVATSTGSANFVLAGGTLKLTANIPVLTASAGSTFNFTMGTGGGTINTNGFSSTMNQVINGSTGLTKSGLGTLTLNAANTYAGTTTVNGGTLLLDMSLNNTGVLVSTSPLALGGGTLSIMGKGAGASSQTLASLALTAGTSSNIVVNPNTGSSTILTLGGTTASTGAALNFNYSSGTTNGATVGNNIVMWNPALTGGIIGTGYTVTDAGGTGYATVNGSGQVIRLADTGTSGLPASSGGGAGNNYFIDSGYSTTSTTTDGSLVEALSAGVAANTLAIDTTGLATGANLALGANTLTLTNGGSITIGGANPYAITTTGAGGLTTNTAGGNFIINNLNTSVVTIGAPILNNTASTFTLNGTGTLALSGANTYTGATTISGVLQIADPGVLNAGTYAGTISDNGTLQYSSTLGQTLSGVISGSGGITKDSSTSTLTLSAANTFTGPVVIKAGTLSITNATAISTSSSLTLGDALASSGTPTLALGAVQTYSNPINVVGVNQSNTISQSVGTQTINGAVAFSGNSTLTVLATAGGTTITGGFTGAKQPSPQTKRHKQHVDHTGNPVNMTGTITNSGTSATNPTTISSVIGTNVMGVVENGTNQLLLSGANTYTSGTTLTAGVLRINNGSAAVSTSSAIGTGSLTIASGSIDNTSGAAITLGTNNAQIWNGDFTFTGASSLNLGTGTVLLGSTAGVRTVTVTANTLTVGGAISNGTATGLTKAGAGTLSLGGSNAYTGTTSVNAGTLQSTAAGALPSGTTLAFTNTTGTATLDITGLNQTVANLTLGTQTTGTNTVTILGNASTSLTTSPAALTIAPAAGTTSSVLTLDMSSLNAFTYNNSSGAVTVGGTANTSSTTWKLPTTTTITAATFTAGPNGVGTGPDNATVTMGKNVTINANTIGLSNQKYQANLAFAGGLTSPSLTIQGTSGAGSFAAMTFGILNDVSTTAYTNTFDSTAGTISAFLSALTISSANAGGTAGRQSNITSNFSIGSGTLQVTGGIVIGQLTGTANNSIEKAIGTFSMNGASVYANTIKLGDAQVAYTGAGTTATGTFNLTSGSLYTASIANGIAPRLQRAHLTGRLEPSEIFPATWPLRVEPG